MQDVINGPEPYAVSDFAVAGLVRIITNDRIYKGDAATIDEALAFATAIREQPHAMVVNPGSRFWEIFTGLCRSANATGKLVPDAYLAALAIEHGCEFVTDDQGFRQFPGLRWRHPLN
jgi:toxin-antitoxin system PIN domain toxin